MKKFLHIILILSIPVLFIWMSSCQKAKQTRTSAPIEDTGAHKEKIVVAGTGANQELVRALALTFMKNNKNVTVEVPDSIGSGGGISEVTAKRIDIARVARPLKDKEKRDGLIYKSFAFTPIVFASSTDITVKNLTRLNVYKMYSGQIRNWKETGGNDLDIKLIGREPGDSSLSIIEKEFGKLEYSKGLIHITTTDQEMVEELKNSQGAIGFGTLSNMKNERLHIFTIDDIEAISKEYPLKGEFGFVYWETGFKGVIKDFISFVFSNEGRDVILREYCIPSQ